MVGMLRHQQQLLTQVCHGGVVPMGPQLGLKVTDTLDAGGVLHLIQDPKRLDAELAGRVYVAGAAMECRRTT
jgi:hypothetical protein